MWWKRPVNMIGAVYFRGSLPPRLENLEGLRKAGIEARPTPPGEGLLWSADLKHPKWGSAELVAQRERQPMPEFLVDSGPGLSPSEREQLRQHAQTPLLLRVPAERGDVLRDRKRLLRFMQAVLGSDGVAAEDAMAQTVWTPARLADELQHDAPLDIIQLHVLHVVQQPQGDWLHSHGLAELGFVDFDVLRPAEEITGSQFDVLRSIAFLIVEGARSGAIEPVLGADPIELVPAATFMRGAAQADRELRDPEGHTDDRVVCCDGRAPGFFARLLGSGEVRPSRLLSRGMQEGRHLVRFSKEATELCAERARECLPLFESLRAEFEELQCMALAKIGYPTDSGGDDREHLWFEVHALEAGALDATLLNEPFDIAAMKAGQRSKHPTDLLTDWAIMTPAGQITPRSLELARTVREHREEILAELRAGAGEG